MFVKLLNSVKFDTFLVSNLAVSKIILTFVLLEVKQTSPTIAKMLKNEKQTQELKEQIASLRELAQISLDTWQNMLEYLQSKGMLEDYFAYMVERQKQNKSK